RATPAPVPRSPTHPGHHDPSVPLFEREGTARALICDQALSVQSVPVLPQPPITVHPLRPLSIGTGLVLPGTARYSLSPPRERPTRGQSARQTRFPSGPPAK